MRLFLSLALLSFSLILSAQSWKPSAEAAIQELRTSPVSISVVDGSGNPLPGATVRLRMRESAFRWGSIIQMGAVEDVLVEGVPIGGNHPYWNHLRNFNSLGAGNAGKWKQWLNDSERATYLDIMDWQRENDIAIRLHAPIWPSIRRWNAVPDTVLNARATADKSRNEVIREIIRGFLTDYMQTAAEKGAYEVDLVNELVHEPDLNVDLMGQENIDERIDEHSDWHRWAFDAAPEVGLIVNEYDLYQSGNDFHERFVDYVSKMIERGAPVDGVGMQGHFFGEIPAYEELKQRLAEVAVLGLPMALTEFDMVNNTYAEMERVLYSLYSEPLVNNFTVWGAWDGQQWRGNAPIYNLDWSLKPSGRAYFDYVKGHWLTDTTVVTTQEPLTLIGHHGSYDLYVEHEGRVYQNSFDLMRGQDQNIVVTVSASSSGYALPEAVLDLAGNPSTVFPNQPFSLTVNANAPIREVTYFDDDQIIGYDDESPFILTTSREISGQTIVPVAEVEYESGYRQRLTADAFTVDSQNQAPRIQDIFPASGSLLLARDTIRITVSGVDPNGDRLRARLLTPQGDTLLATGGINDFAFTAGDLGLGSQRLTLVLDDGKFAEDRQTILYNIVANQTTLTAVSFPAEANDDVEERTNGNVDVTGDLDLGERLTGIRFVAAGIPAGATIDSAFVQFTSEKPDQTGPISMDIFGEAEVDPIGLSGGANNLSSRKATEARVAWENLPAWLVLGESGERQRTPDVAPIVREVTSQDGWNVNRPLHLFLDFGTGGSKRSAYAVDQNPSFRPTLTTFYRVAVDTSPVLAPIDLNAASIDRLATEVTWTDPNPTGSSLGYELELDGDLLPQTPRQRRFTFTDLLPGTYSLRVRTVGELGKISPFSDEIILQISAGEVCLEEGGVQAIEDGLVVEDLGKAYNPLSTVVPDYLQFRNSNLGGTTSVRRNDSTTLKWKTQGYYQRNRELGQIFNVPEGDTVTIDAVVLRTGNSSSAVLSNAPGAPVYIQFYEVIGQPTINDNGTPQGTPSTHGFSDNHRTDDYLDGIAYVPLAVVRGGSFPDIEPTTNDGGQTGHLRYLRWNLLDEAEITLAGGRRYAFTVGFTEPGPEFGFSLGNDNHAASSAAPELRSDANGQHWWSIRREGDGTLPPTQVPGDAPPQDDSLRLSLIGESLYEESFECSLMPTTDGFPDVDTYRTLEFYVETTSDCPPVGQACDDGLPETDNDLTDGNCGCRGIPTDGCRPNGRLLYSRYEDIPGRSVDDLRMADKYTEMPDLVDTLLTFEVPNNVADNYGARVSGYLCPPQSGIYGFWIAGDDNVELYLSTDEEPANARRIAYHNDFTEPYQWDKYATQQSAYIYLEVGQPVYVEALLKEAGGGDHLAVGWQLPDGTFQRPISGANISTITGDALSTSTRDPERSFRSLLVYPNPAGRDFNVTLDYDGPNDDTARLRLLSIDGQEIYGRHLSLENGINHLRQTLANYITPGVYFLRVDAAKGTYVGRVVVR